MRFMSRIVTTIALTAMLLGTLALPSWAGKPPPKTTQPSADLSLTIAESAERAPWIQEITYQLTVRNAGPSSTRAGLWAATDHNMPLQPAGPLQGMFGAVAPITSVASTRGTCSTYDSSGLGIPIYAHGLRCDFGVMGTGETARVTLTARPSGAGTVSLRGSVSYDTYQTQDPNTANNEATESTDAMPLVGGGCASSLTAIESNGGSNACAFASTGAKVTASGHFRSAPIRALWYSEAPVYVTMKVWDSSGKVLATCTGVWGCDVSSSEPIPAGLLLVCFASAHQEQWWSALGAGAYACTG